MFAIYPLVIYLSRLKHDASNARAAIKDAVRPKISSHFGAHPYYEGQRDNCCSQQEDMREPVG